MQFNLYLFYSGICFQTKTFHFDLIWSEPKIPIQMNPTLIWTNFNPLNLMSINLNKSDSFRTISIPFNLFRTTIFQSESIRNLIRTRVSFVILIWMIFKPFQSVTPIFMNESETNPKDFQSFPICSPLSEWFRNQSELTFKSFSIIKIIKV